MEFAPKEIVAATDFSANARFAADHASAIARSSGAHVTLVHVLPRGTLELVGLPGHERAVFQFEDALRRHAIRSLDEEVRRIASDGLQVAGKLLSGPIGDAIAGEAEQLHADLVVAGSQGRTGFSRVLLGSGAESILRRSRCPVLIVRMPRPTRST